MQAKQVEINGITYESTPETNHCSGCIAESDSYLCKIITKKAGCTYGEHIIWIKKEKTEVKSEMKPEPQTENTTEPKYTIEEFSEAYANSVGVHVSGWDMLQIKKYLAKQSSPEYQLYLKLKEQFGE